METGFLQSARMQFAYYKQLGDKTFSQVSDEALRWEPAAGSNSMAVIVKHLWGNMMSRWTDFLTTDGEKEWRNREAEFDNDISTRAALLSKWEEGWACLFAAMDSLKEDDLGRIIHIRNQGHTVMEAINRQLAHYPYHVGQIVMLGKMASGEGWQSLSIPRGKSADYNAEKFSQPKRKEHFTTEMLTHHTHTLPLLREELRRAHEELWHTVASLDAARLVQAPAHKWNALQHMIHIHLGVDAMAKYLALPKQIISEKFGRMDRPSMNLTDLKAAYHARLAQGVVPPDRFTPPAAEAGQLSALMEQGRAALESLLQGTHLWNEEELDSFMCPHPAMGPLTAREMLMFTVFHAEHHRMSIATLTA